MAEVVTADLLHAAGFCEPITVDSAGLGDWHVGEPADPRALAALSARGFDGSSHTARFFNPVELTATDLIIALDESHFDALHALNKEVIGTADIVLLRSFDPAAEEPLGVADPYYGEQSDFDLVLGQIIDATKGLTEHLMKHVGHSMKHANEAPHHVRG